MVYLKFDFLFLIWAERLLKTGLIYKENRFRGHPKGQLT